MANTKERVKKKDVDLRALADKLLDFANANFQKNMKFDVVAAKKHFGYTRGIIVEAYAFGAQDLKRYELVESKSAQVLKDTSPPVLSGKGTITIKKQYVDAYNAANPDNPWNTGDTFEIEIGTGSLILKKAE
jgi:hypothetical protein